MNEFFVSRLPVSKILLCMRVLPDNCKLLHKCRLSHGLVLMLNGCNRYEFEDKTELTVRKGELFYLPKFSSYRVMQLEKGECLAVNFDLTNESVSFPPFSLSAEYEVKFTDLFTSLLSGWNQRTPTGNNVCYAKLYEILCAVQSAALKTYVAPKVKKIAADSAEYIRENISRPSLSIQEIANLYEISPEYYRKIFAQTHGLSPKKYIVTLRIEKAKELLLSGEYTVKQLYELCGFSDESYFCKLFKLCTGQTPNEYARYH